MWYYKTDNTVNFILQFAVKAGLNGVTMYRFNSQESISLKLEHEAWSAAYLLNVQIPLYYIIIHVYVFITKHILW